MRIRLARKLVRRLREYEDAVDAAILSGDFAGAWLPHRPKIQPFIRAWHRLPAADAGRWPVGMPDHQCRRVAE
jgi:hypothetical protein